MSIDVGINILFRDGFRKQNFKGFYFVEKRKDGFSKDLKLRRRLIRIDNGELFNMLGVRECGGNWGQIREDFMGCVFCIENQNRNVQYV